MTDTRMIEGGAGRIESINAVTLATGDMAASLAFYQALGMRLRYGGADARFTSLQSGACHVNLSAALVVSAAPFPGRVIFYVDDVDAAYTKICTAGYVPETAPADAPWGERFFHIRDPSGHELSLARPLAAAGRDPVGEID
jgi:catechol 2,3-dioxygenase-like lactoylglutathione lyase family enzyme